MKAQRHRGNCKGVRRPEISEDIYQKAVKSVEDSGLPKKEWGIGNQISYWAEMGSICEDFCFTPDALREFLKGKEKEIFEFFDYESGE